GRCHGPGGSAGLRGAFRPRPHGRIATTTDPGGRGATIQTLAIARHGRGGIAKLRLQIWGRPVGGVLRSPFRVRGKTQGARLVGPRTEGTSPAEVRRLAGATHWMA